MATKNGGFAIRSTAVKMAVFMTEHNDIIFTPKSLAASLKINDHTARRILRDMEKAGCVENKDGLYKMDFYLKMKFDKLVVFSKSWKKRNEVIA